MLIAVLFVLVIGLLLVADRVVKVTKRGLRRKEANRRLVAAAAVAEDRNRRRTAAAEVSGALTSVFPAIAEHETRHVE